MEPPDTCQRCHRPADPGRLEYRRGERVVSHGALLQCDLCDRLACAECLDVYDILSGYDFLCHDCAREAEPARLRAAVAQNQPARPFDTKEVAAPTASSPRLNRRATNG